MKQGDSYSIYYHLNMLNGKIYIGQSKNPEKRWSTSNYKGCIKLYHAFKKYGRENFKSEVLINNLSIDEANIIEEYLINYYKTIENGYNIKSGGLNNIYTEKSKIKMRKSAKSKKSIMCIETGKVYESAMDIERLLGFANANIIACCRNKIKTAYGYHWCYFGKQHKYKILKDKRKRKVKCIETGIIYESASNAARKLKLQRPNITRCCQGQLKETGGLHWTYI